MQLPRHTRVRKSSRMSAKSDGPVFVRQASNREGEDLTPDELSRLHAIKDLKSAKLTLYQFDARYVRASGSVCGMHCTLSHLAHVSVDAFCYCSPPCWKVRALLNYYGIPYESVTAYPGSKIEGLDNTYTKIPKLVVNEVQINDSAVVYRSLARVLTGSPLTATQIELESRNNITGLLGALEKESFGSYMGIVGAVKAVTAANKSWSYAVFKPVLPYLAGLAFPLPKMVLGRSTPHGKDGTSLEHGAVYRAALGEQKYFHGEAIGPVDLSLYGTLACFLFLQSPSAHAMLNSCDLRAWYDRVDAKVKAVRPLDQ